MKQSGIFYFHRARFKKTSVIPSLCLSIRFCVSFFCCGQPLELVSAIFGSENEPHSTLNKTFKTTTTKIENFPKFRNFQAVFWGAMRHFLRGWFSTGSAATCRPTVGNTQKSRFSRFRLHKKITAKHQLLLPPHEFALFSHRKSFHGKFHVLLLKFS